MGSDVLLTRSSQVWLKPKSVRLPQKSKGFAYVGFASEADRKKAVAAKNRSFIEGHQVQVRPFDKLLSSMTNIDHNTIFIQNFLFRADDFTSSPERPSWSPRRSRRRRGCRHRLTKITRSGPKIPAAGHLEGEIFWDLWIN